jgi:glutaredoxin
VPALEALLERFEAAHCQPLGLSVDSRHSHANWARSLGGVSFPLLSDFHPKGEVARSYGLYLEDAGITDRATVIIDAGGVVRYVQSVSPSGQRDIAKLAEECERIDREYQGELPPAGRGPGLDTDCHLFVKSSCGFSRAVLLARDNLHLGDRLVVRNVSEEPDALTELERLTGKKQAPCLVVDGQPMFESQDIIRHLVTRVTGLWPGRE